MTDKDEQDEHLTDEQRAAGKITLKERKALGKAKKLWGIEIICSMGLETKRHHLENQTDREVFQFRQHIFTAGLMLPIDPGTWVVIPPWDIKTIFINRQSKFFEP